MKRPTKSMAVITIVIGLLVWIYLQGRKERQLEEQQESPISTVARIKIIDGRTILTFDETTRNENGIVVKSVSENDIPASAVVWLDDKAWVYIEEAPDHFARHEVTGGRMVVIGAEQLLSEEFRSQIQDSEGN